MNREIPILLQGTTTDLRVVRRSTLDKIIDIYQRWETDPNYSSDLAMLAIARIMKETT